MLSVGGLVLVSSTVGGRLAKKVDAFEKPGVEVVTAAIGGEVDEWLKTDWRCVSHVGSAPRVAIEDVCITILGADCDSVGDIGIVESISRTPNQPNEVLFDDLASAGFWREGTLPMNAARMAEKS